MYSLKIIKDRELEHAEREFQMDLTRRFMALFANANRGKNQAPFTPQDFWRLSYDKDAVVEEKALSFKEAKALLGSKIRRANQDGR
jgi:hypothetical protein